MKRSDKLVIRQEKIFRALGFVFAGKNRSTVFLALRNGPLLPKHVVEITGLRFSRVSTNLSELNARGLVRCIAPTAVKGRPYVLTDLGREVLTEINQISDCKVKIE